MTWAVLFPAAVAFCSMQHIAQVNQPLNSPRAVPMFPTRMVKQTREPEFWSLAESCADHHAPFRGLIRQSGGQSFLLLDTVVDIPARVWPDRIVCLPNFRHQQQVRILFPHT